MVSFCPRCGAEGGFGAAGCRRCGHQFAGWAVFADLGQACARCGHQGPADASYCVRCGTPAPEARFNDDDTVFFRRDAFQALQATPRPGGRVCVVCGHRNVPGDEFCARCETILPLGDGDTVPPRRAAAAVAPPFARGPAAPMPRDAPPPSEPARRAAAPPPPLPSPPTPPPAPPPVPVGSVPSAPAVDLDATIHWPASAVAAVRAAAGQRPEPDDDDVQETRQLTEDDFETRILDDATMAAAGGAGRSTGRRRLIWAVLSIGGLAVAATAIFAFMSSRPAGLARTAPALDSPPPPAMAAPVVAQAAPASVPASATGKGAAKPARRGASAASAPYPRQGSRAMPAAATPPPSKDLSLQAAVTAPQPPQPALRPTAARGESASPPPPPSVQASCSIGGSFFSEQICRVRLCQQPEHARDPICIEHRRMEAQSHRNDAP